MSEDRRIVKTKKTLKRTMISLLGEMPFEKITVKAICDASDTSRVTFYTHYNDKFDLIDSIFEDMMNSAAQDFDNMQKANNLNNDAVMSYCNMLDCIMNVFTKYIGIFKYPNSEKNPYLSSMFYKYILRCVEYMVEKESGTLRPKYSLKKTTGFITYGLWGFVNESRQENTHIDIIRKEAKEILRGLLKSEVLTDNRRH